jgi:spore maturation protein CgeB
MRRLGWSPSVRLFEAAACGTPIISDRWRGLDEILPENEAILIADSTEDVLAALDDDGEGRCESLAHEARRRVVNEHSGRARARELARELSGPPATQRTTTSSEGTSHA